MGGPLDVLTAVGRELAASRDEEEALAAMARLVVPDIADWVSVGVREHDGRLRRVAVVHTDPAKAVDAQLLLAHPAVVPPGPVGPAEASASGHVLVYEEVGDDVLARAGLDPPVVDLYHRLGCRSAASLLLAARGRLLGGMLLVHGPSGRRFGGDDIPVLEDLARRCAVAVDAARLRREAGAAVRERDALLATVPVPMAMVAADGTVLRLNDAMAALGGCAAEECRGQPLGDVLPDLAEHLAPVVAEAAAGRAEADVELRRDGRVWTASAYPVPDDGDGDGDADGDGRGDGDGDGSAMASAVGLVLVEVTKERATAAELARRAAQQGAVAHLGRRAVAGATVDELVAVAAGTAAATVGVTLVPSWPAAPGDVVVVDPADPPGPLVARPGNGAAVDEADAAFLRAVGTMLVAAAARHAAEEEVRDGRRRLVLALEAGRMASFEWDLATGTLHWSEALPTAVGAGLGPVHPVSDVVDLVHPDDRDDLVATVQRAVDEGTAFEVGFRVAALDGEVRWVEARGAVIGERVVGVAADVTDRRRVEDVERAARDRLRFEAEASAALGGSLDAAATFATVARLAVPDLADWCIVDAVDDAGRLRQAAVAHRDPGMVDAVVAARRRRAVPGGDAPWIIAAVAATARPELVPVIDDRRVEEVAVDADHLELLRRLDPRSMVVVPLVARDRVVGVLTLVVTADRPHYGPDDLVAAEDLASRAAVAVDNARLFEDRSRVADALRRTLLPPALPDVPGIELASRYHASAGGSDISGDFYDVFETGDGALCLVIGDVCGKGPAAAALTGLFRHTVRAAAVRAPSPRQVLEAVNEALLGQVDEGRFGSAALVRLVREGDGLVATLSSGGHPLPVVVRAGGEVVTVECSGTVLGVVASPALEECVEELGPGDVLVLYTDGVTEARRNGELFGEDRLGEVLARVAGATADEVAAAVEGAALAFQGGVSDDDLAVLVLRVVP